MEKQLNGNAFLHLIRRDTEDLEIIYRYTRFSDWFRSDLGFITYKNLKEIYIMA